MKRLHSTNVLANSHQRYRRRNRLNLLCLALFSALGGSFPLSRSLFSKALCTPWSSARKNLRLVSQSKSRIFVPLPPMAPPCLQKVIVEECFPYDQNLLASSPRRATSNLVEMPIRPVVPVSLVKVDDRDRLPSFGHPLVKRHPNAVSSNEQPLQIRTRSSFQNFLPNKTIPYQAIYLLGLTVIVR